MNNNSAHTVAVGRPTLEMGEEILKGIFQHRCEVRPSTARGRKSNGRSALLQVPHIYEPIALAEYSESGCGTSISGLHSLTLFHGLRLENKVPEPWWVETEPLRYSQGPP